MSLTPIARKVVARMKQVTRAKVIDLHAVIAGQKNAQMLQDTVVQDKALKGFHPAHAAYVHTQNQLSVMAEQLTQLEEMDAFTKLISQAEDEYLPSGPPMSPLTKSYFTCWSLFDAAVGAARETLGTTIVQVGAEFGTHPTLLRLMGLMQDSRMGVYGVDGYRDDLVELRELVTDTSCRAVCASGYVGTKGELWYARILPPPLPGQTEHIVFTTPYVLVAPGAQEWRSYFDRILPESPTAIRREALHRHLKWGPARNFWNEFVFEGYVNHEPGAIFLQGLPDMPESRPHSRVSRKARGE